MRFSITTFLACAILTQGPSHLTMSKALNFQPAEATCRVKVTALPALEGKDGQITTRAWLNVGKISRGKLPDTICVETLGSSREGGGLIARMS